MHVAKLAVLDEERVAARCGALAEQHALGAVLGDLDIGCDAVRPVQHLRCCEVRDRLRVRPVGVAVARQRDQRLLGHHPGEAAAVDRHHVVLAGLDVPGADHGDQPVAVVGGHVLGLREVVGDVVELPAGRVERGERLRRDRLAESLAGLGERRPGPGADRPPAVVVDRPVAEHLEVLRVVVGLRLRVVEGVGEADAVHGRLADAPDRGRRLDPEQVEHGRDHVDDVRVLRADLALALDLLRPRDDERVAGTATVRLALPAPERCVAGPRPPPRVVVEVLRTADLVDQLQALLQRLLRVVEELRLVRRPGRAALCATHRCRR